jgi:hypothetical protein
MSGSTLADKAGSIHDAEPHGNHPFVRLATRIDEDVTSGLFGNGLNDVGVGERPVLAIHPELTLQITGGKKHGEERAALFAVRGNFLVR